MKRSIIVTVAILFSGLCMAQGPVGRWKKISHISVFDGQQFDSHKALLSQRPCAAKISWDILADGTFRLDAGSSGCDENYKKTQERLYSKTKWKLDGNNIMISATNFAVGQTYSISIKGNKMTWVGTEGQGTIEYEKITGN